VHYWKFLEGFFAFMEVPRGNLCIIRSQSLDFVHCQKIIVEFCALFEVIHGILCISEDPRGVLSFKNPMNNFKNIM
jgi:hypothetical protein